jgi:hypothetical protein
MFVAILYSAKSLLKFFLFCESESVFRLRVCYSRHQTLFFFAYLSTHTRHKAQQQRVEAWSDWSLRPEQRVFGSLKHVIALTKTQA